MFTFKLAEPTRLTTPLAAPVRVETWETALKFTTPLFATAPRTNVVEVLVKSAVPLAPTVSALPEGMLPEMVSLPALTVVRPVYVLEDEPRTSSPVPAFVKPCPAPVTPRLR